MVETGILGLNYPEFPDSCLRWQFMLRRDVLYAQADVLLGGLKERCHLSLRQPERLVLDPQLMAGRPVGRRVEHEPGGRVVRWRQVIRHGHERSSRCSREAAGIHGGSVQGFRLGGGLSGQSTPVVRWRLCDEVDFATDRRVCSVVRTEPGLRPV
jgi:hypothetical protein